MAEKQVLGNYWSLIKFQMFNFCFKLLNTYCRKLKGPFLLLLQMVMALKLALTVN